MCGNEHGERDRRKARALVSARPKRSEGEGSRRRPDEDTEGRAAHRTAEIKVSDALKREVRRGR